MSVYHLQLGYTKILVSQRSFNTIAIYICFEGASVYMFRAGAGNLFTITGSMDCALFLEGRKMD